MSTTEQQVSTEERCETRPVGRPRSTQASEAIIDAVLDLLYHGTTIEALSMEAVAARAGVGKATIYRRWPNKEALVLEAVACLKGPSPKVLGRSVREDLVTVLRSIADKTASPEQQVLISVLPEIRRNPELSARYAELMDARRDVTREVLRRGIASGELAPDLDIELALAVLSGPMVGVVGMRMFPRVHRERLAERLVELVLSGFVPRPGAAAEAAAAAAAE
ncbi:MAG: TetR/AcrR family transcriptional regulator, partial [Micromonosporaceae bacterium]